METIINYISKFSDMVKDSMEQTKACIGKEVIDSTAGKKGVCVDRITDFGGSKISFLGVKYDKKEIDQLNEIGEDVLVIKGERDKFFISMDNVSAVGGSVILLKEELKTPEITANNIKTGDVFKRYDLTLDTIKEILPSALPSFEQSKENNKKWINKLIGE